MSDIPPQNTLPPPRPAPLTPEEIERAKRKCKRIGDSRLRETIERFLNDPAQASEEDVSRVLSATLDISAWRWRKYQLAMWTLGRMPLSPAKKQQATSALADFLKKPILPGFYQVPILWTLVITVLAGVIALLNRFSIGEALGVGAATFFGSSIFVWLIASIWGDLRFNLLRATAAESLGIIALPESAEAIAYAMYDAVYNRKGAFDRRLRTSAGVALPQALASLTPAHYLQMGAPFVPNLCHLLDHVKEPVQLDIIEALGKMGDGRAVVPIKRFALKSKSHAARASADRILPILEQRQALEVAHSTLLRPSSRPQDDQSVLLRPAYGGYQDAPQTLLRPVETPPPTFDLGDTKAESANSNPL